MSIIISVLKIIFNFCFNILTYFLLSKRVYLCISEYALIYDMLSPKDEVNESKIGKTIQDESSKGKF